MNAYQAAYENAIWVDLNAQGRIQLTDRDRTTLIHRMSTNDLLALQPGQAAQTVLTTPIGRMIDLLTVLNEGETTLVITGQGRGDQIFAYFRRNIFFNDRVKLTNLTDSTAMIGVYGAQAAALLGIPPLELHHFTRQDDVLVLRTKPLAGDGYWVLGEKAAIQTVIERLSQAGVIQADEATFNLLRIEQGYPQVNHELSEDFIPLEAGLWDVVSFTKGCYTGQEIIARMESRHKLAKMLVQLSADEFVPEGSTLYAEQEKVGTLTSIAPHPAGHYLGLGFVKKSTDVLQADTGISLKVIGIAGVQR